MEPETTDDKFDSLFERCFFRADSVQIGLATSNFLTGMVRCFQIKHRYMKHIVVPGFEQ